MDSFFAVCCVLAVGIFVGSTVTAWIGLQLEKRDNAKLELKYYILQESMDLGRWDSPASIDKAVETVLNAKIK